MVSSARGGTAGGSSHVGVRVRRRQTRAMRVIVTIIGAIVGLSLANGSHELFGLLLGGCVGFGLVELGSLRVKLKELEDEVGALRKLAAQKPKRDADAQEGAAGATGQASGWSA